jgi:hypothetical protein
VDLSPPPPHPDKQETPVVEKFRRLALEGVANELEQPSDEEQGERAIAPASASKKTSPRQENRIR